MPALLAIGILYAPSSIFDSITNNQPFAAAFGPWLGITVVQFLRPISTLLFALEIAAFGTHAAAYVALHLVVHCLATALVWAIAARLAPRPAWLPGMAALLFAIYPLHPNAVVFAASFATLFGGFLALLAFHQYLCWREDESRRVHWWLALGAYALALGSYEAATVVPAWLAACDHLRGDRVPRRHRELVAGRADGLQQQALHPWRLYHKHGRDQSDLRV